METRRAWKSEESNLLSKNEDHFLDFKGKSIMPGKLQETFVAFANADGGELYVGIEDKKNIGQRINGFNDKEEANAFLEVLLEQTDPSVDNLDVEFIDFGEQGLVLHISIPKSPKVHFTTQKKCYLRVNASKIEIKGERILSLGYAKGSYQYEKQAVKSVELDELLDSPYLAEYMTKIETHLSPDRFVKKQRLTEKIDDVYYPNVCGVLLFDDEPQASLDTRCSVKLYRMRTTTNEYDRKYLHGMPRTVVGNLETLISSTLNEIDIMLDDTLYNVHGDLKKKKYPTTAIKEIVVNAIIHRDYSLSDDVHITIYDDRIEIKSPGTLPGFITINNIYDERYSRNPNVVRLLHKLPDPPNHDIGEGLNTAKNELHNVGLIPPIIEEKDNAVVVTIKHTLIASIEQVIRDLYRENPERALTNKMVRNVSGREDINAVKKAFQKLRKKGYVKLKEGAASVFDYEYILDTTGIEDWIDAENEAELLNV